MGNVFFDDGVDPALHGLCICDLLRFPRLPFHSRVHDGETRDAVEGGDAEVETRGFGRFIRVDGGLGFCGEGFTYWEKGLRVRVAVSVRYVVLGPSSALLGESADWSG